MSSVETILILAGITCVVLALVGTGCGWLAVLLSATDAASRRRIGADADD